MLFAVARCHCEVAANDNCVVGELRDVDVDVSEKLLKTITHIFDSLVFGLIVVQSNKLNL